MVDNSFRLNLGRLREMGKHGNWHTFILPGTYRNVNTTRYVVDIARAPMLSPHTARWAHRPARATAWEFRDLQLMSPGLKKCAEFVGCKIRELRKNARMKQADLAKAAGLTPRDISRLENGENIATHLTLAKIADSLSVDVGFIDPTAD